MIDDFSYTGFEFECGIFFIHTHTLIPGKSYETTKFQFC